MEKIRKVTTQIVKNSFVVAVVKSVLIPIALIWFGYHFGSRDSRKAGESQRIIWKDKIRQLNIICANNLQDELIAEYNRIIDEMVLNTEHDREIYGIIKFQLGYIYMKLTDGDFELAVDNLLVAKEMVDSDNSNLNSEINSMLGTCHFELGIKNRDVSKFKDGEDYFKKAYSYDKTIHKNQYAQIYFDHLLARTDDRMTYYIQDYADAANSAIADFKRLGDPSFCSDDFLVARSFERIGSIYLNLSSQERYRHLLDSAKVFFEKALNLTNIELHPGFYTYLLGDLAKMYMGYYNVSQDDEDIRESVSIYSVILDRVDSASHSRSYNLNKLNWIAGKYKLLNEPSLSELDQLSKSVSSLRRFFRNINDQQSVAGCYWVEFESCFRLYLKDSSNAVFERAIEYYEETERALKQGYNKMQYAYFEHNASVLFAKKYRVSGDSSFLLKAIDCYDKGCVYVDFSWPYHIPGYSKKFRVKFDSTVLENKDTNWQEVIIDGF